MKKEWKCEGCGRCFDEEFYQDAKDCCPPYLIYRCPDCGQGQESEGECTYCNPSSFMAEQLESEV